MTSKTPSLLNRIMASLSRLVRRGPAPVVPPPVLPPAFVFLSASATHVGKVRQVNEDSLLDRPDLEVWAVADGVGGHSAGDVASSTVVQMLAKLGPPQPGGDRRIGMRNALRDAHAALHAITAERGGKPIGTTVVAFTVLQTHYLCLWSGDSRAYRLRGGEFTQLTRDHSVVQDLVDQGVITESEAERHPQRNIVTAAVGADGELRLDAIEDPIEPGDLFLLCSDGLCKTVAKEMIGATLAGNPPAEAANKLIDLALAAGGPDNIAIVIIRADRYAPLRRPGR